MITAAKAAWGCLQRSSRGNWLKGYRFGRRLSHGTHGGCTRECEGRKQVLNRAASSTKLASPAAKKSKKQLKEKYSDQWTDPADGDAPQIKEDED